jgi:molecular chaperone DnaK
MSRIVGIDLGTSTSEIAVIEDGKPFVIPNHLGEYITPSVVGTSDGGEIIVGQEARDQLLLKPNETAIEVKRFMGSGESVSMGGKEYSPQEISSFILAYLIDCAQKHLGENIDRAVISVPAYFSDTQRRATVEAGKLAGIKVERIINEPTAAALDYGIDHLDQYQNVLVYDLGGGTLDVTVLEMFAGVLDVKASCGNNQLGGKDFDQRLADHILDKFTAQHKIDVSADKRAMMRLKDAVEKAKVALSTQPQAELLIPFFTNVGGNPVSLETTISREIFESLIKELIDSTADQIKIALSDAGLGSSELDLILLVGGSTRIPYVRHFIEQTLGQAPQSLIDPDLAVVRGAAIQAGLLDERFSGDNEMIITDVCPFTLGTSILSYSSGFPDGDVYDVILPRNVTIPVVREKVYGTAVDDQTKVEVDVYQGEFKKASHNNFLGKFMLSGIPPAPAFQEKVSISYAYDVNGILQVEAKILSTDKKAGLTIETTGVEMIREVDTTGWDKVPAARKYRAIIKKAGRMVENGEALYHANEMDSLIAKLKTALIQDEKADVLNRYKEELQKMIYELTEESDD